MGEKADIESKALRRVKKKYYKMIIRRLPYEMTEEELLEKLSPLPPHERFWFRKAEDYLEDDAFPYAFIVFDDFDVAAKFQRTFNGQLFADSDGNESTVIVEKAANQDYSREPLKPKPGVTPITEDIGFIQFLEEAELKSITKKVDFDVLVNEITERERKHAEGICQDTPLTDYFIQKLHEKIVKNRPKPKKFEPKGGAKIEKGESKPKDKKEKSIRGGATREPKYRGEPLPKEKTDADSLATETSEKKKRERPRRIFENKKIQKEAFNGENGAQLKDNVRKQNSSSPKIEGKETIIKSNNTAAVNQDEKPKERKPVGPSQRNKDRPERAIYQPRPRGSRGKSTATPSSTTQNENVAIE
jgi:regulator of nonsense transcripts 3|uniref:UPF3 domain-containing protein n=1 Tax=Panagrolaimus sp. PS1159 TaxID=55785 RepID=A0AC35EUC0_9BILA